MRRSPWWKIDYKYAFLLHKHTILLTWDRNTFPSPTLHPPLERCFFSFFFLLMAWHYCYFRAVVYFWIVQVRGGILEQSQNGKRRKNKLKKKIRNQKFTKGDAISQLEGYSSECLLYIDWKKRKTRCRVENISWRCWKEIPFRFIVRVMSLLWVLILLFYFFFLCWNVIHMWLHVIQSDSFLSLSFWLYGGHVCCI